MREHRAIQRTWWTRNRVIEQPGGRVQTMQWARGRHIFIGRFTLEIISELKAKDKQGGPFYLT